MREIVGTGREETENKENDSVCHRLASDHRTARTPPIMHKRGEQAEDRSGRTDGDERTTETAQGEPHHAGNRVDDHHPAWPISLRRLRRKLAEPHHIKKDVKKTPVKPSCSQYRPPAVIFKYRSGAARTE